MSVSADLGLQPIINAAGTSTSVGGPLMLPAAAADMWPASVLLERLRAVLVS